MADTSGEHEGTSMIQIRAALIGLIISAALGSAVPLIGVFVLVVVFAAYTNGLTEENEASGGAE